MTPDQRAQFAALIGPWCSEGLIVDLIGVSLSEERRLDASFRAWAKKFLGRDNVERQTTAGLQIDRHAFETFLVQNGLISWKWAGVYLGMTADKLKEVVERLVGEATCPPLESGISDQLIREREAAQLFRAFPSLHRRTFSNHSGMCRALHEAIRMDFGMEIEPLLCVTSQVLDSDNPDIASAFDAITREPVGNRYQVWLDTKKPINLRADVCSLKFYAQSETELRDYVIKGSEPDHIDNRLRAA